MMRESTLEDLIKESIQLEMNISELYGLFSESLPNDGAFWNQLRLEEKSHATLLRAARDSFSKNDRFPADLIADSIDELKRSNAKTETFITRFKAEPPTRKEACHAAIELEKTAGEAHYTRFMEKDAGNPVEAVFQQLNRDDKAHAERIRAHCRSIGAED